MDVDQDLGAAMLAALPHPWCRTCQHEHVAYMPAHTWRCDQCGFGSRAAHVAAQHARLHPEHEIGPVFHDMVLLDPDVVAARGNPPSEEA